MKKKRLEKILELINEYDIENQEVLMQYLAKEGFEVTQATISRDIKELGLVKEISKFGGYKYASRKHDAKENVNKFISIFRESVLSIDYAMNIIVIKSYAGMANAACAAIDAMAWRGILGTIAGDDTIFVVCRTEELAMELNKEISLLIKK